MSQEETAGWRRVMRARDPGESHRASTPLELLFDLCFVVAVAQAAAQWHHAMADGHAAAGLPGYLMVFFAIWWAWMNFTWFASAYDVDDTPYRLLTLLQMAGVLVLAAGVPAAMGPDNDFALITAGYVVMRVALIGQWLRAAAEHPAGRGTALRYAGGIAVLQVGWVVRLALPYPWGYIGFGVLVAAELALPAWAESRGTPTSWHPGHIAERYGLFTIIVLGEVILGTLVGLRSALSEHGLSASLLLIAAGGLVLVFTLWWIYFTSEESELPSLRTALTWGYGHYVVFAAAAALGSGLEVAIDAAEHAPHAAASAAAYAVAIPVAVYLVVLALLQRLTGAGRGGRPAVVAGGAAVLLAIPLATNLLGIGAAVLAIGLAAAATLTGYLALGHRHTRVTPATAG